MWWHHLEFRLNSQISRHILIPVVLLNCIKGSLSAEQHQLDSSQSIQLIRDDWVWSQDSKERSCWGRYGTGVNWVQSQDSEERLCWGRHGRGVDWVQSQDSEVPQSGRKPPWGPEIT